MDKKPLGRKNYGSIPHLIGSKLGPGDHHVSEGQHNIATVAAVPNKKGCKRRVIVQEKVDGSNVGVAKIKGEIVPITRAGYRACTSPFEMHHKFEEWVMKPKNKSRFDELLKEGERLVGEWMYQAHGLYYDLPHEPFIALDLMMGPERMCYDYFLAKVYNKFVTPKLVWVGDAFPIENFEKIESGHGCKAKPEGLVYRVETQIKSNTPNLYVVEFLCKYVRPDFEPGIFLKGDGVFNGIPEGIL